jgi:hypothetical protein
MNPAKARTALPPAIVCMVSVATVLCMGGAIGAFAPDYIAPACAAGAARHWKACGLAAGLGIGAVVYGMAAPLAGLIALAASQVAAMFC